MHPTEFLDVSFNQMTRELVVTFDRERIMFPLMYNLLDYWRIQRSETNVSF